MFGETDGGVLFSPWGDVKQCRVGSVTIQIICVMETDEDVGVGVPGEFHVTYSGNSCEKIKAVRNQNKALFVSFSANSEKVMILVTHEGVGKKTPSVGGYPKCK